MATVVITVQDTGDGRVKIVSKSDPEVLTLKDATDAQLLAQFMLMFARKANAKDISSETEEPKQ